MISDSSYPINFNPAKNTKNNREFSIQEKSLNISDIHRQNLQILEDCSFTEINNESNLKKQESNSMTPLINQYVSGSSNSEKPKFYVQQIPRADNDYILNPKSYDSPNLKPKAKLKLQDQIQSFNSPPSKDRRAIPTQKYKDVSYSSILQEVQTESKVKPNSGIKIPKMALIIEENGTPVQSKRKINIQKRKLKVNKKNRQLNKIQKQEKKKKKVDFYLKVCGFEWLPAYPKFRLQKRESFPFGIRYPFEKQVVEKGETVFYLIDDEVTSSKLNANKYLNVIQVDHPPVK